MQQERDNFLSAKSILVAAFPGVGKTTLTKSYPMVADSDSSTFDKAHFPGNYLAHIVAQVRSRMPTLVSSHSLVRQGLHQLGIQYYLVYPEKGLKKEYLERYRNRNSSQGLINIIDQNWNRWIDECQAQPGCEHVELRSGEYLSDRILVQELRQPESIAYQFHLHAWRAELPIKSRSPIAAA